LAGRFGVAKYENGERRLDMAEFMTIAEELGVDPVKLLEGI
jgi:transcriptional regulator with XRE-family HTH domain